MRLIVLLGVVLAVVACANQPHHPAPTGELFAAIELTETTPGVSFKKTGVFFYIRYWPGIGPMINAYDYDDGKIVDVAYGGNRLAEKLIAELSELEFVPFDYDAEVQQAQEGKDVIRIRLDGAGYRIVITTDQGVFEARSRWFSEDIDDYGAESVNLAKLGAALELLAAFYGRSKLPLL